MARETITLTNRDGYFDALGSTSSYLLYAGPLDQLRSDPIYLPLTNRPSSKNLVFEIIIEAATDLDLDGAIEIVASTSDGL